MDNEQISDRLLSGDSSPHGEPHDERLLLTAYALGELTESEAAEVENLLRDSAGDGQIVSELSRFGKLLRKVAAESPLPQESAELRAAVLSELDNPTVEPALRLTERFPRRRFWLPLSLAASLAVVCGALVALTKTKHAGPTIAQSDFIIRAPEVADELNDLSETIADLEEPTEPSPLARGTGETADAYGEERQRFFFAASPEDRGGQAERLQIVAGGQFTDNMKRLSGGMAGQPNGPFAAGSEMGSSPLPPPSLPNSRQSARLRQIGGAIKAPAGGTVDAPGMMPGYGRSSVRIADKRLRELAAQFELDAAELEYDNQKQRYRSLMSQLASAAVEQKVASEAERQLFKAAVRLEEARQNLTNDLQGNKQLASAPTSESYSQLIENPFRKPTEYPLSTFSIDVDTASYSNVRRFLNANAMPPHDAVRVEELINYFQYAYPQPEDDRPFSVTTDVADCPWNAEHRLLRVGLKGRERAAEARPASNLVFLLDVSGSMDAPNKLPLVKEAMSLLTEKLTEKDRVAIVVYAGSSGLALPPTNGTNKAAIRAAIAQLAADGSTNGGQGLQMAYDTAQSQFIKGGTNRVILATDGDFNVGLVNPDELVTLIADKAKSGVYFTALGFGMGNLKDDTLEKLADKGNGNYAYIDTLAEARRVLIEQLSGTLVTIAKDVKLQIEFNPAQAASYRLIGYENRLMPPQDFHDDRKDAGEIGAGHTVTALYEIVPAAAAAERGGPLKYQPARQQADAKNTGELATIQLRYKDPDAAESRLFEHVVSDHRPPHAVANGDFQFAAAVAEFGMLLRDSPYRGAASYQSVLALAEQGLGNDAQGYRSQFIDLVRKARELSGKE